MHVEASLGRKCEESRRVPTGLLDRLLERNVVGVLERWDVLGGFFRGSVGERGAERRRLGDAAS